MGEKIYTTEWGERTRHKGGLITWKTLISSPTSIALYFRGSTVSIFSCKEDSWKIYVCLNTSFIIILGRHWESHGRT